MQSNHSTAWGWGRGFRLRSWAQFSQNLCEEYSGTKLANLCDSKCCHESQVYKCHICGKVSTSGSKFKLHKISVHEGFSTSCGPCGVILKYRGIMKMQESRIHWTAEDIKEVIDNTIEVSRFKEFHGSNSCTF